MKDKLSSIFDIKVLATLFSRDWLLRFISLFLAVVLWYFVGGEDRVDKTVMVPLEIINLPRDLVISNQFKKEMEVTVSGPRTQIMEMAEKGVTRQVDLSSASPGSMVIETRNEQVPVPRGVTVQRVQPSSIILSLDKLIQKHFPVSARTVGKVANGYFIKSLTTDPAEITITGPQTILSQVDELYTKAINLTGVKQSGQLQVPLELDAAIVELIGETSVTAELHIALETQTIVYDDLKVHVTIDGAPVVVDPPTVQVTARVPDLLLKKTTDPNDFISVTAERQTGYDGLRVVVSAKSSAGFPVEVVEVNPQTVFLANEKSGSRPKGESGHVQFSASGKADVEMVKLVKQIREESNSAGSGGVIVIKRDRVKKYIEQ
ncbi:CdaR family protein [Desulforhopalus singaporensis]|uniref:YbbR-like protein n=1 Tax=Desulforhopalus singaporensis TaxID=91360 RepID=A0A1H0P3K4_9BACT|nr:CdaR family protein [Desulforhopalus singaporensis]SDO99657.1 YbbR-like protein [Desulforhopalus singaporensis]